MDSVTTTRKVFVALRDGTPLSTTLVVKVFVLGPCASVGVHEIAPVFVLIVMPLGAVTRLKASVFVGTSGSVADAETFNVVNSFSV